MDELLGHRYVPVGRAPPPDEGMICVDQVTGQIVIVPDNVVKVLKQAEKRTELSAYNRSALAMRSSGGSLVSSSARPSGSHSGSHIVQTGGATKNALPAAEEAQDTAASKVAKKKRNKKNKKASPDDAGGAATPGSSPSADPPKAVLQPSNISPEERGARSSTGEAADTTSKGCMKKSDSSNTPVHDFGDSFWQKEVVAIEENSSWSQEVVASGPGKHMCYYLANLGYNSVVETYPNLKPQLILGRNITKLRKKDVTGYFCEKAPLGKEVQLALKTKSNKTQPGKDAQWAADLKLDLGKNESLKQFVYDRTEKFPYECAEDFLKDIFCLHEPGSTSSPKTSQRGGATSEQSAAVVTAIANEVLWYDASVRCHLREGLVVLLNAKNCRSFRLAVLEKVCHAAVQVLQEFLPSAAKKQEQVDSATESTSTTAEQVASDEHVDIENSANKELVQTAVARFQHFCQWLQQELDDFTLQLFDDDGKAAKAVRTELTAVVNMFKLCSSSKDSTYSNNCAAAGEKKDCAQGKNFYLQTEDHQLDVLLSCSRQLLGSAVWKGVGSLKHLIAFVEQLHEVGDVGDSVWKELTCSSGSLSTSTSLSSTKRAEVVAAPFEEEDDDSEDEQSVSEYESLDGDADENGLSLEQARAPAADEDPRAPQRQTCCIRLRKKCVDSSFGSLEKSSHSFPEQSQTAIFSDLPLLLRCYQGAAYVRGLRSPLAKQRFDELLACFVEDELKKLTDLSKVAAVRPHEIDESSFAADFWPPVLDLMSTRNGELYTQLDPQPFVLEDQLPMASEIATTETAIAQSTPAEVSIGRCGVAGEDKKELNTDRLIRALRDPIEFLDLFLFEAARAGNPWIVSVPFAMEKLLTSFLQHAFVQDLLRDQDAALRLGAMLRKALGRLREREPGCMCFIKAALPDRQETSYEFLSRLQGVFAQTFDNLGRSRYLHQVPESIFVFLPLLLDGVGDVHKPLQLRGDVTEHLTGCLCDVLDFLGQRVCTDDDEFGLDATSRTMANKFLLAEGARDEQCRRNYRAAVGKLVQASRVHCDTIFTASLPVREVAEKSRKYSVAGQLDRNCGKLVDAHAAVTGCIHASSPAALTVADTAEEFVDTKALLSCSWGFKLEVVLPVLDALVQTCADRVQAVCIFLQREERRQQQLFLDAFKEAEKLENRIRNTILQDGIGALLKGHLLGRTYEAYCATRDSRPLPCDPDAEPIFAVMTLGKMTERKAAEATGKNPLAKSMAAAAEDSNAGRTSRDLRVAFERHCKPKLIFDQQGQCTGLTPLKLLCLLCTHAATATAEQFLDFVEDTTVEELEVVGGVEDEDLEERGAFNAQKLVEDVAAAQQSSKDDEPAKEQAFTGENLHTKDVVEGREPAAPTQVESKVVSAEPSSSVQPLARAASATEVDQTEKGIASSVENNWIQRGVGKKDFYSEEGYALGIINDSNHIVVKNNFRHESSRRYLEDNNIKCFESDMHMKNDSPRLIWVMFTMAETNIKDTRLQRPGSYVQFQIDMSRAPILEQNSPHGKATYFAINSSVWRASWQYQSYEWVLQEPTVHHRSQTRLDRKQSDMLNEELFADHTDVAATGKEPTKRAWACVFHDMKFAREDFRQQHDGRSLLGQIAYRADDSFVKKVGFVKPLGPREGAEFPEVKTMLGKNKMENFGKSAQFIHVDLKGLARHARLEPIKGDVVSFTLDEDSKKVSEVVSGRKKYLPARDLHVVRYKSTINSGARTGSASSPMRGLRHLLKLLEPVYTKSLTSTSVADFEKELGWYSLVSEALQQFQDVASSPEDATTTNRTRRRANTASRGDASTRNGPGDGDLSDFSDASSDAFDEEDDAFLGPGDEDVSMRQRSQAELEALRKRTALITSGESGAAFFQLCVEELLQLLDVSFHFPLTADEMAEVGAGNQDLYLQGGGGGTLGATSYVTSRSSSVLPARSSGATTVWGVAPSVVGATLAEERARLVNAILGLMMSFEREYRQRVGVTVKAPGEPQNPNIDPRQCLDATRHSSLLVTFLSALTHLAESRQSASAAQLDLVARALARCFKLKEKASPNSSPADSAFQKPRGDRGQQKQSALSKSKSNNKSSGSALLLRSSSSSSQQNASHLAGLSVVGLTGVSELFQFVVANVQIYDPNLIEGFRALFSSGPLRALQTRAETALLYDVHGFLEQAQKTHLNAMRFLAQRAQVAQGTREELEEKHWSELPLIPTLDELRDDRLGNLPVVPDVRAAVRKFMNESRAGADSARGETTSIIGLRGYESYEHYMNTILRQLRQDTFSSLRMGVSRYIRSRTVDFGLMRMYNPQFVGFHFRDQDTISVVLKVQAMKDSRTGDYNKYWADNGGMMYGNLIVISLDGDFEDEGRLVYAQVSWSDKEILRTEGIFFAEILPREITGSERSPMEQVIALIAALSSGDNEAVLAESPAYYKAFSPGLKCLQGKKQLENLPPFASEFIFGTKSYAGPHLVPGRESGPRSGVFPAWSTPTEPAPFYLNQWPGATVEIGLLDQQATSEDGSAVESTSRRMRVDECVPVLLSKKGEEGRNANDRSLDSNVATALDEFQQHAVGVVLSRAIAAIQGAPGCGKSHLAVLLVRLLASLRDKNGAPVRLRFLIVTYKNKALNELAEALLKYFPKDLVRVGSGGTGEDSSELLESRNLNLLKSAYQQTEESHAFNEEWKRADKRLDVVSTEMEELATRLVKARFWSISLFVLRSRPGQLEQLLRGAGEKGHLQMSVNELSKCLTEAEQWVTRMRQIRNKDLTLANFLDCEAEYLKDPVLHKTRLDLYACLSDALEKWVPQMQWFQAVAERVRQHKVIGGRKLDLQNDRKFKSLVVELKDGKRTRAFEERNAAHELQESSGSNSASSTSLAAQNYASNGASLEDDDEEDFLKEAQYQRDAGEMMDNNVLSVEPRRGRRYNNQGQGVRGNRMTFKDWEDHKKHVIFLDASTSDAIRYAPEVTEYFASRKPNLLKRKDLWSLDNGDRVLLVQFLLQERVDEIVEKLIVKEREYTQLKEERKRIADEQRAAVFRANQICVTTITGAAIYAKEIEKAAFDVVLVEEAAEVLEGQLVAMLNGSVKHLIMIGDHYQLPPPVQSSVLRERFFFGRSLMHELIDMWQAMELLSPGGRGGAGATAATSSNVCISGEAILMRQSRMDPEIAKYLRADRSGGRNEARYPKLKDNLNIVGKYTREALPLVYPVEKRDAVFIADFLHHAPVFFWDTPLKGTWCDERQELSFKNHEEAERQLAVFMLMVSQGIPAHKITITAPYRAHIRYIKTELMPKAKKARRDYLMCAWSIAGLELAEEREARFAALDEDPLLKCFDEVVCTPLDGYQGNQNDHIILALVRSNSTLDCGFLKKEPEGICRRTVAQSRARKSWIIIGSADCFGHDRCGGGNSKAARRGSKDKISIAEEPSEPEKNGGSFRSNSVWGAGLIDHLRKDNRVSETLPLKCPRHDPPVRNSNPASCGEEGTTGEAAIASGANAKTPSFFPACASELSDPVICQDLPEVESDQDPLSFTNRLICTKICNRELPSCGHACRRYCHAGECDARFCREIVLTPCAKFPDKHLALRRVCNAPEVVCQAEVQFTCKKVRSDGGRQVSCNTTLTRKCYQNGDLVQHLVDFPCKKCTRPIEAPCDTKPADLRCKENCQRKLACGHACPLLCWEECRKAKCQVRVTQKCAAGKHTIEMPCWRTTGFGKVSQLQFICRAEVAFTCPVCNRKQKKFCGESETHCNFPCGKLCSAGLHACTARCGECAATGTCLASGECRKCAGDELQYQVDRIFRNAAGSNAPNNTRRQFRSFKLSQLSFPEPAVYNLWLRSYGGANYARDHHDQEAKTPVHLEDTIQEIKDLQRSDIFGGAAGEKRLLDLLPKDLDVVQVSFGMCVAMDPQLLYVLRRCFGPEQKISVRFFRTKDDFNKVSTAKFQQVVPSEKDTFEFEEIQLRPFPATTKPGLVSRRPEVDQHDPTHAILDSGNILHFHELAALQTVRVGASTFTTEKRRTNFRYLLWVFRSLIRRYPKCEIKIPIYRDKADAFKRDHVGIFNEMLRLEHERCVQAKVSPRTERELFTIVRHGQDVDLYCLKLAVLYSSPATRVAIVTNDAYREHRENFPSLKTNFDTGKLLVPFTIVPEEEVALF
ncbi:unnamed protein product [Amoebophrya sp. A120]|nr:unnamed protein product [Amoebophrya sp. A120]|eukprot:GSA120T00001595001.1